MKKIAFIILFLVICKGIFAEKVKIGKLYYELNKLTQTAEVTSDKNEEYSGDIVIPSAVTSCAYNVADSTFTYITYSVTSIGDDAFWNCTSLTSVIIPYSVTSIGDWAFYGCTGLTSVIIPYSVTSIGDKAFGYCNSLTSIIVDAKNPKYDSRYNCNAIVETTTNTLIVGCKSTAIPNSVTSIGNQAFLKCTDLMNITIPNSVTSIGEYAFYGCSSLTSVTIPYSVTNIGEVAFHGCSSLTSISVDTNNSTYDSRENCNAIIETATNTLVIGLHSTIIPNSVTSIGGWAFYDCIGLTSITIPNSVTNIGWAAFRSCSGLTSITIPNSVTSIGGYAFFDCGSLTAITLPNSVTNIGEGAFYRCSSLTSVIIPNSVTSIGDKAFGSCNSLTSIIVDAKNPKYDSRYNCNAIIETITNTLIVGCKSTTIPNSVTSIGEAAFAHCSGLMNVTIPNSLRSIGKNAFSGCKGLTSVIIPNSVTSIGEYAFYDCRGLTSITIPNSVVSVEERVFSNCYSLKSVTIPSNVRSIKGGAFNGCHGLTSVIIHNGVVSIEGGAFAWCENLISITIPNSVTSIGENAFFYCSSLTSVTIPNSVTSIGKGAFSGCTVYEAEQGNANAQNKLGVMYHNGEGVEQDYAQALYWYRKSAEQENKWAQLNLGVMYEHGLGVEQDYAQALYWYRKSAEQGNANAQTNLGVMYHNGEGVEKDYTQALYWFRKSAEQGNEGAQLYLGVMYHNGEGVEQDYAQALYWYGRSAEQENEWAQNNLGVMYEHGLGVEQDYSIAMQWYKKAMDGGHEEAKQRYDELTSPALLQLVDGSWEFTDASNNNCIDSEEQCSILFKVQNIGKGIAQNCEVRVSLSGTKRGITVQNIQLPIIAAGKSYEVAIPVVSDINTQDGTLTFSVEVFEPNGWGVAPFDVTVQTKAYEPPFLQVTDYKIASNSGKINKMEFFTLTFNLQNVKYGDAEDVRVKINLPANVFVMEGSTELSVPFLKSGEVKPVSLKLVVNNNFSSTNIPVTIDIKEKYGKYAEDKTIDIALNQATPGSIYIAAKEDPSRAKEIQIATLHSAVDKNIPISEHQRENSFAVIIANENYERVDPVPFALNDGAIFREYCIKTLGIQEKRVHYIPNATFIRLKEEIRWLRTITETYENSNIIVYYAGHGIPDESSKSAYLLPVDGSGADVSTGYKLDDLYAILGKMPASQITVFMDACFSGSKREEGMLASARGVALKAKSGMPQGNVVVFSAAQGDETAYPNREQQHGLFTYYLLKKLQETNGDVSLNELGEYVIKQVSQQSLLLNSKKQTPSVTPSAQLGTAWQTWTLK